MTLPVIDDDDLPEDLYHYTDAGGLHGILESNRLWATHAAYLNDSQEFVYGMQVIINELSAWVKDVPEEAKQGWDPALPLPGVMIPVAIWLSAAAVAAHLQQRTQFLRQNFGPFVTCLSEEGDQLSQWRGYGGGGGYAIRFDPQALRESVQRNGVPSDQRLPGMTPGQVPVGARRFVKMEYEPETQAPLLRSQLVGFINAISGVLTTQRLPQTVLEQRRNEIVEPFLGWLLGTRFKHPGFKEEKEYRIVTFSPPELFSPQDTGLVPRVNIEFDPSCITEVWIGPGQHMDTRESSVRAYLQRHQDRYPNVTVHRSETPFTGI
jgi:hypothetical protein